MRSAFVVFAAIAATVIAGGPAVAAEPKFRDKPLAQKAAMLHLSSDAVADRGGSKVFIVQMAGDPAIRYQGGVSGFAKSAPEKGQRYDARSSQAQMYAERLGQQQDAVLARVGASGNKIYSFRHVFNGFAARMSAQQADKLRKDKSVLQVWEDQAMALDTNSSPRFLGILDEKDGLRGKHDLRGEDVIIGVLDSGIVQEHPSLDPTGFGPAPAGWAGVCETGPGFTATDCNNKLIGARFYVDGFGAGNVVPTEFLSPRDSDGHGTHTATTAGGNEHVAAFLAGKKIAWISGIAPRARIAAYKVCWQAPGAPSSSCFFSDSAAATEQAIIDGVDILTFSVGTAFSFIDPQDLAFLFATDAGIFVSRSAGNEGPGPETTAAGEPWVTTVAASTHGGPLFTNVTTVNSPASVAGDYSSLESGISKSLQETGPITDDLIAASPIDACVPLAAGSLSGGIGLVARGGCDFSVKLTNAANAGAIAVLMYTNANPKTVMGGAATPESLSIPAVMIDNAPGLAILDAINGGAMVNVTLSADNFTRERMQGNIMAGFSSRGPFPTVRDWIKPDITAPGVNVLAGATPEPNDGSFGGYFQYLSGTSMSTPHIAGLAALLREAHPDWTPAMIKSALMTSARQNVKKEDGATKADPFDFGAGHVNPNRALDPGLVYDAGFLDYLAGACGTSEAAGLFADPAATCAQLESFGYSTDASDLNLPSIGIAEVPGKQTVMRYVTNVSDKGSKYNASVRSPPGYKTEVKPASMWLAPGETKSYTVTFTNRNAPPGEWRFGSLTWEDNKKHEVRSPIALRGQALVAPDVVQGTGESGSESFNVTFGYNGTYVAGAHGLIDPFLTLVPVEDDPANSFDFSLEADEPLVYLFEAPPGAAALEFSTFDAYNDNPGHDLDLYVFYCPDFACTQVGASLNATSNESVRVPFPANDPAIDDPYAVFVHGFNTAGGAPATSIFFDWTVEGPVGNLTVTGPSTAAIAQEGQIDLQWSGLNSGPAWKYRGAASHSDGVTIQDATFIEIDNDAGGGFCDFVACP